MKSLKNLIIPIIVLVVLLIGAIVVLFNKSAEEPETETTNVSVLQLTSTQLTNFSVTDKSGVCIGFESYVDNDGVINFRLVGGDDSVSYSQSKIGSYIGILCNYVATSTVNNPTNLADYGLADPDYTINMTSMDGQNYTIYIGSSTYDNSGCYFQLAGDENVYITAQIKRIYAGYKTIDFIESQVLNIDYSQINTLQFDRLSDNTHITTTCDMSSTGDPIYNVIEPYKIGTSPYFENLVEYIATLEIAGFIDIPEDQLAEYGLDNPNFHFKFTMDSGEVVEIYLSSLMNAFYYGYCSNINGYFQINAMQINGLDTPILTLLESYISYAPASSVNKIVLSNGDRTYTMDLDVDSAISDPGSSVTINSRNAIIRTSAGRSYAAIAYESFATITLGGIALDDNPAYSADEVALTMTVYKNDYSTITYEFIPRNSDSYYVFIDGSFSYFFVSGRELFRNSGTDTYNYGIWEAFELANYAIDNQINGIFDIPEDYGEAN